MPALSFSQVDSSYIGFYEQKLSVKLYLSKNFIWLSEVVEEDPEKDIVYMPNNPANLGVGLSWKNSVLSFSYGYGFDFLRDKEFGRTKSMDFQFHNYGRKHVIDLFIQKYKGFYIDEKDVILYPDLQIRQYGLHGQYVLNGKKFSYRAALDQNEIQLRSAGSFTFGGGVYFTNIKTEEHSFLDDQHEINNFQFGISGGYAHTWVINKNWFISGSVTVGINFGDESFRKFGSRNFGVSPTVFPRFSVGFDKYDWSLGLNYINNFIFPSFSENSHIGIFSGSFQLSFTRRFHTIPLIKVKENSLLNKL